jgi:putative intracellular protease/amidase
MRWIGWALAALLVLGAVSMSAILLALPAHREPPPTAAMPSQSSAVDREQVLAALHPPKHARPLIAVLAQNEGTETTDFLVPIGVLRASGAADVVAVAPREAPITLMPVLRARPDQSFASFDRDHPEGADFVIVPALHHWDDAEVSHWLAAQARGGAIPVGICEGAWVVAQAGLLDGHAATTHWFSANRLRERYPGLHWAADQRYVVDRGVVTTTGVSASIPISLTLVEAFAGEERARALAQQLGEPRFGPEHESAAFALDRRSAWTAMHNYLAFWSWDSVEIPLGDGVDEVALALTADAYARTFRTSVRAVGPQAEVTSRSGLHLMADAPRSARSEDDEIGLPAPGNSALAAALGGIGRRYGPATADFVALQLEYDLTE